MTRFPIIAIAFLALLLAATLAASPDATAASTPPATFTGIVCKDYNCGDPGDSFDLIARIDTVECGRTLVSPIQDGPAQNIFQIEVASADTTPGCGTEGATVTFEVDGETANESSPWHGGSTTQVTITFGEPFMSLSGDLFRGGQLWEGSGSGGFYIGPIIRVYIGSTLCAEKITVRGIPGPIGYDYMVIPPASHLPGCGTTGAPMTITLDDVPAAESVSWAPGFYNQDLSVPSPTVATYSTFSGGMCVDLRCNAVATVTATIGGIACGEGRLSHADAPTKAYYFYSIDVPSAETTPGCGTDGATVKFALDGRPATPTGVWRAGQFQNTNLVVGEPFAAFSGQVSLNNSPLSSTDGDVVKAYIAGNECGASADVVANYDQNGMPGSYYESLIIPAASSRPGCGTEGAKITFTINGVPAEETAIWTVGFHTLNLGGDLPTSPPNDGGNPTDRGHQPWLLASALALLTAGLITLTAANRPKHRTGPPTNRSS